MTSLLAVLVLLAAGTPCARARVGIEGSSGTLAEPTCDDPRACDENDSALVGEVHTDGSVREAPAVGKTSDGRRDTVVIVYATRDHLPRAAHTIASIRHSGSYAGDIVFIHTDDLDAATVAHQLGCHNVTAVIFPRITTPTWTNPYYRSKRLSDDGAWAYHMKFRAFDRYFLQWRRALYIDAGATVFKPLRHILELNVTGRLLAHSDCWPDFTWRMARMFHPDEYPATAAAVAVRFGSLDIDYFASTMMYYDTAAAIRSDTVDTLYGLVFDYPSGHGDQAYLALYFCRIRPIYEMIPHETTETLLFDIIPRSGPAQDHVIVKNAYHTLEPSWLCA